MMSPKAFLNLSSFSLENLESKFQSLSHVFYNVLWRTVNWQQLLHQEAIIFTHVIRIGTEHVGN